VTDKLVLVADFFKMPGFATHENINHRKATDKRLPTVALLTERKNVETAVI
jgi:hypothetical protein